MALSGQYFNIGVFDSAPRLHLSTNTAGALEATGLVADIIYMMADFLGFSFTFIPTQKNKFGRQLPNGSWDGMAGKIFYKEIDFDGVGLIPDSNRIDYFDFTTLPLFSSYMAVIVHQPSEKELDLTTYLKPFSIDIWIITIIMCFLLWICNFVDDNKIFKFSEMFSLTKILLPIYMCFAILTACYNSLLIASVTVGDNIQTYDTLDDLVQEDFNYRIQKSGIYYTLINNVKSYPFGEVAQRLNADENSDVVNDVDAIQKVLNGKFAFVTNSVTALQYIKEYCSLDMLATQYFQSGNYFTFSKNSNLTEIFSLFLNKMASSGVRRKLTNHYIPKSRPHCDTSKYRSKAITIFQVLLPFFLLGTGIIFSLIVCVIEWQLDKIFTTKN